jgi:kinesin family protein C1
LVQSALDGYKVCLFSYGQTGAGKTYTMLGQGEGERRGIVPRAVSKVLEQAEALRAKGYEYTMEASYVEIYNEQIRDLLCPGATHSERHHIVNAPEGGCPTVAGVVREEVTSVYEATSLVRRAMKVREVAETEMNANSSRSHTLFLLYITGVHQATGQTLTGCLNLVDLAGSERTKRSGARGQRMTEACAINKSLSCLGDVFAAVGRGDKHIPYRNSKLTYLLAPCLGGEGKTLMVVNIAPDLDSAEESMCSLRFASTVNQVELGNGKKAKRNIAHNFAHLSNGGAEDPASGTKRTRRVSATALANRDNAMYDRRSSAGSKRTNPFAQNERAPKTRRKAWE